MTGKSGRGTARQTFRFDSQLWEWFGQHTPDDADRTDLLKAFILWWMHAGELPQRPADAPPRDGLEAALTEEAKRQASKSAATAKADAE